MVSQPQSTITSASIPSPSPVTYQTSQSSGTTRIQTIDVPRSR
jgi:hypothetical protein